MRSDNFDIVNWPTARGYEAAQMVAHAARIRPITEATDVDTRLLCRFDGRLGPETALCDAAVSHYNDYDCSSPGPLTGAGRTNATVEISSA